MRSINIGLTDEQRNGVIEMLNKNLSDSYLLLIKTKKFHWDVIGPQFRTLHELWEEQYQALSENIDSIAERVRMLGGYPVGTAQGFLDLATVQESPGNVPSPTDMVGILVDDHETIIRTLRENIDRSSEEFHDEGTADFLTGLMEQHEEMAWMLRSFLEGETLHTSGASIAESKTPVGA